MDFLHNNLPCRAEDPELFHPVGTSGPAARQIEQAKAVCRRCPVTAACLDWALRHGELGVWGGTTDGERRRRATSRPPRRPAAGHSPQQARRAAAVACVRQGTRRVAVAEQYGISPRTLDRWLAASA